LENFCKTKVDNFRGKVAIPVIIMFSGRRTQLLLIGIVVCWESKVSEGLFEKKGKFIRYVTQKFSAEANDNFVTTTINKS
jgi:hypothetical protein